MGVNNLPKLLLNSAANGARTWDHRSHNSDAPATILLRHLSKALTFYQFPEFMPDPVACRRLRPTCERRMPARTDRRQRGKRVVLRASRLAGLVRPTVVVVLKVDIIQHQERSHQNRLEHLERQITQLLQQQDNH